jgi:Transposase IS66 family
MVWVLHPTSGSHVRRGFYDLAKATAPIAKEALPRIAALYQIEDLVRGKTADDRLAAPRPRVNPWSVICGPGLMPLHWWPKGQCETNAALQGPQTTAYKCTG